MPLSEKDLTPEKIREAVEVLDVLKTLDSKHLETLEILLSKKQASLLEESLKSYRAGEPIYPIESILED